LGRVARQRSQRRLRVREFEKMTAIARRYGAEDLVLMKQTMNAMRWHKRLWQAVKLIAGRL